MRYVFDAELWLWEARRDTWTFAALPAEASAEIREMVGSLARGFGSVPVEVRIGGSVWRTSIFPDARRGYVLPIKKAVQKAESVAAGEVATIEVEVRL